MTSHHCTHDLSASDAEELVDRLGTWGTYDTDTNIEIVSFHNYTHRSTVTLEDEDGHRRSFSIYNKPH